MEFGFDDACLAHDAGTLHPETPDRIEAVLEAVEDREDAQVRATDPAARSTVEAVHDPAYLDRLESFCAAGGGTWSVDTVACRETFGAAFASAGAACWAVDRALERPAPADTPFALCRPPGHHALADDAMGFCFLNNAAVAAERALDHPSVDRVAVFDWDVHHGNGTADLLRDREGAFYASIHEAGLFPGTGVGKTTRFEPGRGSGGAGSGPDSGVAEQDGPTLDVTLPPGAGDADYLVAVDRVVGPRIDAFDPDLVVVSAGFDPSERDHVSDARVTTDGFARLATQVQDVAVRNDAALAFVLEGGYQVRALAEGVCAVNDALVGRHPATDGEAPDPDPETASFSESG